MLAKRNVYTFHEEIDRENIPLCSPYLKISKIFLKRVSKLKFKGVF